MINKFILAEYKKFMPEMHLRQSWFTYSACGTITKNTETKKKRKKKKKQEIQASFIKMNYIKLVLKMSWLMEVLKICLEE